MTDQTYYLILNVVIWLKALAIVAGWLIVVRLILLRRKRK